MYSIFHVFCLQSNFLCFVYRHWVVLSNQQTAARRKSSLVTVDNVFLSLSDAMAVLIVLITRMKEIAPGLHVRYL